MAKFIGGVLVFFIFIMFILMIGQALWEIVNSIGVAIEEFLLNSIWGILAVISLGISVFFFYASVKTYPQVRERGRVIDTIKPLLQNMDNFYNNLKSPNMSKSNALISNFGNKENVIDLSKIDLQTTVRKLAIAINKPNPVFFKGWGNRRLQLDVERVYIIKEYIDAIRSAGESFINLKADAILSYERIDKLVQINRNELLKQLKESELQIDLLQREHRYKVDILKINIRNLETTVYEKLAQIDQMHARTNEILGDLENRSKEVDAEILRRRRESDSEIKRLEEESRARIQLDKDKTDAEIFVMKLKAKDNSKLSKQRSQVLDKIIDEMNLNNIRPIDIYLIVELLNTVSKDNYVDFDSGMKKVNEEIEKMKIDNKIATADARKASAIADEVEAQAKQNIKDLYKNS